MPPKAVDESCPIFDWVAGLTVGSIVLFACWVYEPTCVLGETRPISVNLIKTGQCPNGGIETCVQDIRRKTWQLTCPHNQDYCDVPSEIRVPGTQKLIEAGCTRGGVEVCAPSQSWEFRGHWHLWCNSTIVPCGTLGQVRLVEDWLLDLNGCKYGATETCWPFLDKSGTPAPRWWLKCNSTEPHQQEQHDHEAEHAKEN